MAGRATLSLHFQMDGFVELRLYQTGNIHRIREVQIFHILSEEGDHIRMGPLVGPPGRYRHHRRFGLKLLHPFTGGGFK